MKVDDGAVRRIMVGAVMAASVLAVACAGALHGSARAGVPPQDAEVQAAVPPEARGVTQVVTAAELAAWGRARNDPGAMIMAARLLAEVPVRTGEGPAPILTPARLLDEALAMAPGNEAVQAAVQRVRDGTRGVSSSTFGAGPIFTVQAVGARQTLAFEVEARRGEVLRVAAIGDGDTNIDLVVTGETGNLLCRDGFGDHYPVCTMPASGGGRLKVDVINRGGVWTQVQILSN
jgi:hypothetical protein